MNTCDRLKNSSIGKKQVVALTGLALVGFLVSHLAGNFLMFKSAEAFDTYAEFLEHHPLIIPAEIGLAAFFLVHIVVGLKVFVENRRARPTRYEVESSTSGQPYAARWMGYTGSLTLIFLIVHITTFKFLGPEGEGASLFSWVMFCFRNPLYSLGYVGAMVFLAIHLAHGIKSAFQTLGVSHPQLTPLIEKGGVVIALALTAGFASLPIWALTRGG
ncbi:MAG: succinate dehydrogenase cytochrome b subunit [Elusimicrobia bacterium]|nr:succinate dehydrogenase cytochrome b subunit [Elusimicrobiota bacterium]